MTDQERSKLQSELEEVRLIGAGPFVSPKSIRRQAESRATRAGLPASPETDDEQTKKTTEMKEIRVTQITLITGKEVTIMKPYKEVTDLIEMTERGFITLPDYKNSSGEILYQQINPAHIMRVREITIVTAS